MPVPAVCSKILDSNCLLRPPHALLLLHTIFSFSLSLSPLECFSPYFFINLLIFWFQRRKLHQKCKQNVYGINILDHLAVAHSSKCIAVRKYTNNLPSTHLLSLSLSCCSELLLFSFFILFVLFVYESCFAFEMKNLLTRFQVDVVLFQSAFVACLHSFFLIRSCSFSPS